MQTTPFLTLLDPRAKIKGSRDPLGFQPIWTRFGRQVVSNLTTVTISAREFTVLLLGLYFAEQAVEARYADETHFVECFLKFEQLAAYSRYAWRDQGKNDEALGIRGILRVKSRLNEGGHRLRISASTEDQILSNQKTYGLWGLYTVAARSSGWVQDNVPRLTPTARDFVESQYLPRLDRKGDNIFDFLKSDRDFEPRGKDTRLSQRLAEVCGPQLTASEKPFYKRHLIGAGDDTSAQYTLWKQIRALNQKKRVEPFSMLELRELIKSCRATSDATLEYLATRLEYIRQVETIVAPAALLFGLALARDGQKLTAIAREVSSVWGKRLPHLNPLAFAEALKTLDEGIRLEERARLVQMGEALMAGDYLRALRLLIEQNLVMMGERGGNAWVRLGRDEQVDARFRDDTAQALPPLEKLPDLWLNSYFLNSFKQIGFEVEG